MNSSLRAHVYMVRGDAMTRQYFSGFREGTALFFRSCIPVEEVATLSTVRSGDAGGPAVFRCRLPFMNSLHRSSRY